MPRLICDGCGRRFHGIHETDYPDLCPVCEDPGRFWCTTCFEAEGTEELHGNYYCKDCFPDAPEHICSECGERSDTLVQDGITFGDDPWMVCPECKER